MPDKVRQHLVEIIEHILQKFPLRTRLDCRKQELAEQTPIFKKEDREQGNDKEQPCLLGDVGESESEVLRELRNVVLMADQKRLHKIGGSFAPAMISPDLPCELLPN